MTTQPDTQSRVMTRTAARLAGCDTFYTGKPCRNDHLSPRRVSNGICIACAEAWRAAKKPQATRLLRAGVGMKTRSIELHVEDATYELTARLKDRIRTLTDRPVSNSVLHRSGLKLLAERLDHINTPRAVLELVA